MKIFAVDPDTEVCARWLDDIRLPKMILESAQLLSTAVYLWKDRRTDYGFYKPTHLNHPCTLWTAESTANFSWLFALYISYCREYTFRSKKRHASQKLWPYFYDYYDPDSWPEYWQNSSFYQDMDDVFMAYKLTLLDKWDKDTIPVRFYGELFNGTTDHDY